MNDDASFEITIPVRNGSVPQVHAHATVLTIWGGHEVGIVEAGAILSVGNDSVVLSTTTTEVVLLEVS